MPTNTLYVTKASAGTGKTYTLAAHYVALLMNNVSYKNILAVTFTNKATAEMKERVITYLHAIATQPDLDDVKGFLKRVREVSKTRKLHTFTDAEYSERAKKLEKDILSDYDNMRISTIDAFLQTLLSGLAQALGQAAGFGLDLDLKHAITTAVDQVLSSDVAELPDVRTAVVNCLNERLGNEDKWDLRPSLIKMVKDMYGEKVQSFRDEIVFPTDEHPAYAAQIDAYKKTLTAYKTSPEHKELQSLYEKMKDYKANGVIDGGKNYYTMIRNAGDSVYGLPIEDEKVFKSADIDSLLRPATAKKDAGQFKFVVEKFKNDMAFGETVRKDLIRMAELCDTLRAEYMKAKVCGKYLSDLKLVGYVFNRIRENLRENNTLLLSETACTLVKALKDNDAEFILMKAGIRYKHIMLDEFQDTSTLQWTNFRHLIEEIVSQENGSALIVGDVKQSIYRWRNGDYEIMTGLNDPVQEPNLHSFYNPQDLKRNFRSLSNVVDFNLRTFQLLSKTSDAQVLASMYEEEFLPAQDEVNKGNLNEYFCEGKEGGYVYLQEFATKNSKNAEENAKARESLLTCMFDRMEELFIAGYKKKDMLILCRTSREAQRVLKTFRRLCAMDTTDPDYAKYKNIREAGKIVSVDSFKLDSSVAVNTIVCALKMLERHDNVAEKYITTNHPNVVIKALKKINKYLPLTDLVEQITRICLCTNGEYKGDDIAHLNCFRDLVRSYIGTYGSNLEEFIQYWDDKMCDAAVPATDSDDIQIMTIHTAKGLQAKNVFIPFCSWKVEEDAKKANIIWCETSDLTLDNSAAKAKLPVIFGKSMSDAGFCTEYEDERVKQYVDAVNLLYVACTRAENNLFVLPYKESKTVGSLLVSLYGTAAEWGTLQKPEVKKEEAASSPQKAKMDEPFSFEKAEPCDAAYQSSDADVEFRQSQQSRQLMIQLAGKASQEQENIEFGNLCHAILEHVQTADDAPRIINDFYLRGLIPTAAEKTNIEKLINKLLNHKQAGEWFNGTWTLMREDTVLSPITSGDQTAIEERRMDRVMIRGNEAVVLDYKFGTPKTEYIDQVGKYMHIMLNLGYENVRGYLWYGFEGKLEEVRIK